MDEKKQTVDLSDTKTEIRLTYKEIKTIHFLREPTTDEWLDYRRRTSRFQFKRGRAEATDEATKAPMWLYNKICERVDGFSMNGTGLMELPDWKDKIPPQIKEAVMNIYLSQVEPGEEAEGN